MNWRDLFLRLTEVQVAIIAITLISSIAGGVLKAVCQSTGLKREHFLVGTELCLAAIMFVLVAIVETSRTSATHMGNLSTTWPQAMLAVNILILLLAIHHDSHSVRVAMIGRRSVSFGHVASSWTIGVFTLCVSMFSIIRFTEIC